MRPNIQPNFRPAAPHIEYYNPQRTGLTGPLWFFVHIPAPRYSKYSFSVISSILSVSLEYGSWRLHVATGSAMMMVLGHCGLPLYSSIQWTAKVWWENAMVRNWLIRKSGLELVPWIFGLLINVHWGLTTIAAAPKHFPWQLVSQPQFLSI